jgi:hypothetical protein
MDEEEGQEPLDVVHSRRLTPIAAMVAELFARAGLESVAVPLRTDQEPEPTAGLFPFKVKTGLLTQSVWLLPAEAMVGI